MLKRKRLLPGILTATLVIGFSTPSPSQEGRKPDADVKMAEPIAGDGAQQYCANIVNIAADARIAWEMKRLDDLETQLKQKISELAAKEAESKEWIAKREEFMKKAEDGVVAVYAKMEPEAAAAQLIVMDEATAAAVLSKLNPRVASTILDEMDAGKAAKLTDLMSAAGAPIANRKKS
jgi:flagellar motility protein MotE (MotC chaperone)